MLSSQVWACSALLPPFLSSCCFFPFSYNLFHWAPVAASLHPQSGVLAACPTSPPPIKRYHLGICFFPFQGTEHHQLPPRSTQDQLRSGNNLSPVLQDSLTSHLDLSNSSVTVTDELAHRSRRREGCDHWLISHDGLCWAHILHNV